MVDDDFDEESEYVVLPSVPLSPLTLAIFAISTVSGFVKKVDETLEDFAELLEMHGNYQYDRRKMAEQAALEIETMTGGDQDA